MQGTILKAIYGSPDRPLRIGGAEIPCYVLEDDTRVLARAGFVRAIGRTGKVKGGRKYDDEFQTPVFLTAENLRPFLPSGIDENSTPIPFTTSSGARMIGYRAEFLPQVCEVFLDAKEAGALRPNQMHIAQACKILHRGFARIGIIGLVDEATGFQDVRMRSALQKILERYIAQELQPWVKTFDDDFYKHIFRLNRWSYDPSSVKRPGVIGRWTNDMIYDRLAPGVRDELHKLAERDDKGRLKNKLFQNLTQDQGHPKLKEHLAAVTALMRASNDWDSFKRLLQRSFPKFNTNLEFDYELPQSMSAHR